MQNAWWDKKADELQQLADENSSKGFFAAIKQIYGPQKTLLHQLEMQKVHRFTQRSQKLCPDGGNISASY